MTDLTRDRAEQDLAWVKNRLSEWREQRDANAEDGDRPAVGESEFYVAIHERIVDLMQAGIDARWPSAPHPDTVRLEAQGGMTIDESRRQSKYTGQWVKCSCCGGSGLQMNGDECRGCNGGVVWEYPQGAHALYPGGPYVRG